MTGDRTGAGNGGRHTELAPELWQLAQSILDRLDPAVRAAAARATAGGEGRCQQVWCPVCALAALVTGEQHPLLDVIAENSVALLAVVRAMADSVARSQSAGPNPPEAPTDPSGPDRRAPEDESPPPAPGRYEHIPVTVEE